MNLILIAGGWMLAATVVGFILTAAHLRDIRDRFAFEGWADDTLAVVTEDSCTRPDCQLCQPTSTGDSPGHVCDWCDETDAHYAPPEFDLNDEWARWLRAHGVQS